LIDEFFEINFGNNDLLAIPSWNAKSNDFPPFYHVVQYIRARMRIVRITEHLPGTKKTLRLHHLTDLHCGAPDFDEPALKARIAQIAADPLARWTMGGDGGDLIRHSDRRYSPTELAPRYRQATDISAATKEHLVELFEPITDKCWAWADGNHERSVYTHDGRMLGIETCCALGIEDKFIGYRGFVRVTIHLTKTMKLSQLIDLQHGWQSGRLKGAPLVQAERELGITEADIVLRGHNHQAMAQTFITLGVDGYAKHAIRRMRTVINGGSWKHGYRDGLEEIDRNRISEVEGDLWTETKGFRAEPLGGPILVLRISGNSGDSKHPASIEHSVVFGDLEN
jgi:hypothetical protein